MPIAVAGFSNAAPTVSLLSRVYLKLGTWQWALSPGLDDVSIQGIILVMMQIQHYGLSQLRFFAGSKFYFFNPDLIDSVLNSLLMVVS